MAPGTFSSDNESIEKIENEEKIAHEAWKTAWDSQQDGDHYKKMMIQPMHYSMSNNLNPLQHTIIKYITRYKMKHDDPLIDLEKAKHCIQMLIDWENK